MSQSLQPKVSATCCQLCTAVSTVWMAYWLILRKTGSTKTFTSNVEFWGQQVAAAWPYSKTQIKLWIHLFIHNFWTNFSIHIQYLTLTFIKSKALPEVQLAGGAEGVLGFCTQAACSLAVWKNWTPDSEVVHCSTGVEKPAALEHQLPWTPAPEVTSCLVGMDEVVEMELKK